MPTYRIVTKSGIRGPYTLRVILKGIETGKIPPGAKLEEVETGRRIHAAEVAGGSPAGSPIPPSMPTTQDPRAPLELAEEDLEPLPRYIRGQLRPFGGHPTVPAPVRRSGSGKLIVVAGAAGACIGSLVVGLVLLIALRGDNQKPGDPVAKPEGVPTVTDRPAGNALEGSHPRINNEQVIDDKDTQPAAPTPFTIADLRTFFAEDEFAARRLIGEVVLIQGYLHDPYRAVRDLYADNPTQLYGYYDIYLCDAPSVDLSWLQRNPSRYINLEMSVRHDKWEMIDGSRRVLIAGRLTNQRSLDKVDWKFAD